MMFKELERLSNVQNFLLRKDKIIFTDKNNIIFIDNIGINQKAYFYDLYQNQLIYDFKRRITFLDLASNQEKNIELKSIIKFDGKRYLLLTSKSNQEYCELSVYDLFTNYEKILEEKYYWGIGDIFDRNFYFDENKTLRSLSLLTGEYEWEVDLSTIIKAEANWRVGKILGIAHELLIISIEQPDAYTQALALNIHTGALAWYIPQGMVTNATLQLSADASRLLSITWNHLIEIDTATGAILRDKALDDFVLGKDYRKPNYEGREVVMIQGKLVGDYYYFIGYDWHQGSRLKLDLLGVFNWKTEQIEWVYDFKFTNWQTLINTPEVSQNKLYVLDGDGTLHIFEREPTT